MCSFLGCTFCENISLYREAAPDKVNRKRRRQGKRELEEYYVCRLRGVEYGVDAEGTGGATAHSFRYDVRGHFRNLPDGQLTWVEPTSGDWPMSCTNPKAYRAE